MAKRRTLLEDERLGPKFDWDMYIYNNFPRNYKKHWLVRHFMSTARYLCDQYLNYFPAGKDTIDFGVISCGARACHAMREILFVANNWKKRRELLPPSLIARLLASFVLTKVNFPTLGKLFCSKNLEKMKSGHAAVWRMTFLIPLGTRMARPRHIFGTTASPTCFI